eukprot:TRINITY_DN55944_c0_g1_i1.p1 TRINITY_DN55944_c0_g1~~TRINITY_DN55944_c0_g1_i1.p1  ORF type:complete len:185 (+),score=55.26 TRINITY_DN55944_c0_g1_i1:92-646(+)
MSKADSKVEEEAVALARQQTENEQQRKLQKQQVDEEARKKEARKAAQLKVAQEKAKRRAEEEDALRKEEAERQAVKQAEQIARRKEIENAEKEAKWKHEVAHFAMKVALDEAMREQNEAIRRGRKVQQQEIAEANGKRMAALTGALEQRQSQTKFNFGMLRCCKTETIYESPRGSQEENMISRF